MTRLHALLLEFGCFDIPLEKVAKPYFDMEYKRAASLAAVQRLPIPAYRIGTQKSPWLVSACNTDGQARCIPQPSPVLGIGQRVARGLVSDPQQLVTCTSRISSANRDLLKLRVIRIPEP